ncbi:TfoX/Sxy family protein [Citreicella sp. C3M06]|uniref:TfoX/Sxy family DNA transformation protein n=1 Tax=Roseobacteraceae TaxID=2854170 RepID=UPI001C09EBD1|nr:MULTISPECIES: TfoX/Sxy family DNA transformation protein [Roseobacteraceae]MBU2962122.1 TfoX/Sxy family protein [Citreicella sp. C3M06]MDO6585515.1 TfoX/Sxy family DNA transformation protein [Salipiger sp. 1_MG-2023]
MSGTPISSIRNLGPAVEAACARAGIADAETLREIGADAAYARMLKAGTKPHFVGYFVLHMALQGRPWNDCVGAEKAALRLRFDALKADRGRTGLPPGLETILDQIGVRAPMP